MSATNYFTIYNNMYEDLLSICIPGAPIKGFFNVINAFIEFRSRMMQSKELLGSYLLNGGSRAKLFKGNSELSRLGYKYGGLKIGAADLKLFDQLKVDDWFLQYKIDLEFCE